MSFGVQALSFAASDTQAFKDKAPPHLERKLVTPQSLKAQNYKRCRDPHLLVLVGASVQPEVARQRGAGDFPVREWSFRKLGYSAWGDPYIGIL